MYGYAMRYGENFKNNNRLPQRKLACISRAIDKAFLSYRAYGAFHSGIYAAISREHGEHFTLYSVKSQPPQGKICVNLSE